MGFGTKVEIEGAKRLLDTAKVRVKREAPTYPFFGTRSILKALKAEDPNFKIFQNTSGEPLKPFNLNPRSTKTKSGRDQAEIRQRS